MLWHPGYVPVRTVLLLVSLQFLLGVGDMATDAAIERVGDQLHPVVQSLVSHVQLFCRKPHSKHPVDKFDIHEEF